MISIILSYCDRFIFIQAAFKNIDYPFYIPDNFPFYILFTLPLELQLQKIELQLRGFFNQFMQAFLIIYVLYINSITKK